MTTSTILFSVGNAVILPFWATLILAPKAKITKRLNEGPQAIAFLALLYAALVIPVLGDLLPLLSSPDLQVIQDLLGSPLGASAAWLHFLAFDLLVGRWIWKEALESDRSLLVLRICLCFSLMFGPLGYLFHLLWSSFSNLKPNRSPLTTLSVWMPWLIAFALLGLCLDPRVTTNLPNWIKPIKFSLSLLIYCLTIEAILRRLSQGVVATWVRHVTAGCLAMEILVIYIQAARGTTSHFNIETPLDSFLFSIMGTCIVPVWLAALVATYLTWRERHLEPNLSATLVWGGLIAFVGMAWAWPMTSWGGHTVGAPDGGAGLPILGWSTVAGDLRVPHFVGMHALQILPALWLLCRKSKLWIHFQGTSLMILVCYLGYRAVLGHSAFAMDPVLLCGLSGWVISSAVILRGQQTSARS